MKRFRALSAVYFGAPGEQGEIVAGRVFDNPGQYGIDEPELKRLLDNGAIEETDRPLDDQPVRPLLMGQTVFSPMVSGGQPTPPVLPTYLQAPPEPAQTVVEAGESKDDRAPTAAKRRDRDDRRDGTA